MNTKENEVALYVQGDTVVGGLGLQLKGGEQLTDEQREQIGDRRISHLRQTGYLKTQAELDKAEADRLELLKRGPVTDLVNPNFGTPSMTPEALAGQDNPAADTTEGDGESDDWQSTPVTALGLEGRVANALTAAGLKTAGDVLAYGDEHDGSLQEIDGIGEKSEEEIQSALAKLAKK